MFEEKKSNNWSERYWNQIRRNIGLVSFSEQEKLRKTPIAILGVGGLGGSMVEQLVRAGCEKILICDNEKFEESNLNRQICVKNDIGKYKVDILEDFLKNINPEIRLRKYYEINEKNILEILKNIAFVALTLDNPITSIMISRACSEKKIPMIESFGIPYLCAWWFTSDSVDYETCYEIKTQKMSIQQIIKSQKASLDVQKALLPKVLMFPGIYEIYNREIGVIESMSLGKLALRSFAPIVRMMASYLAFEIIYAGILKLKPMILAPQVIGYDYIRMKPIKFSFI